MSFTVTLYNFSKKENSTGRPASGADFPCVLKDGTGILNPVITLDLGLSSSPAGYNYAYIHAFKDIILSLNGSMTARSGPLS